MSMLDIYQIVGIALFFVLGFRDGFSKKIFGFFGTWGGLIAAIKFLNPVADLISQWISLDAEGSVALAISVMLILSVVIVNVTYRWFGQTGVDTLNIRNRFAGAFLGSCQGLIAVSVVLILLGLFDSPSEEDKKESVLYGKILRIAPLVFDYSTRWMPASASFYEEFSTKIEKPNIPR